MSGSYLLGFKHGQEAAELQWLDSLELAFVANARLAKQVTALQTDSTTLCEVRRALGLPMGATLAEYLGVIGFLLQTGFVRAPNPKDGDA